MASTNGTPASHSPFRRVKAWFPTRSSKNAVKPGASSTSRTGSEGELESFIDTGVDTLILAADMVEKIANVVNKVPLIAPVAALVSEVFQTVKDVREMRGNRDTLHTELCDKMKDFSAATSQESSYHHATERLQKDLKIYRGLLEDASKLVSDFDDKGRLKTTVQYPLWKQKFNDLEKKIHSFEGRFILNRVTDIQMAQTKKDLEEKLYQWLQSPPDMMSKQDEMQRLRHENTGSWFLTGPEFVGWKANPGSLWIRGNSGTGKSVLCSTVIREISTTVDGPSAVAYFYFDFRDEKRQRSNIMLRSIVFQLSAQSSPPYKALGQLHTRLSGVPPNDRDLEQVLDELLSELGRSCIVLDALDECNNHEFPQLVKFIQRLLVGPNTRLLHLLFTSQPRQIFHEGFQDVIHVELISGLTNNDIRLFVTSEVSALKNWAAQSERVTAQVVQKSSGMFRLAACLLQELAHCFWSKEWEKTLNDLPTDLYGVYNRFLGRVHPHHLVYVQAIFRWLIYSRQLVTLHELADAVAFDFSNPSEFIYDPSRREGNSHAIFQWLDGLIVLKKRMNPWEPEESVALAHASVQDYILSTRFRDKFAPGHDFTEGPSHTFLAQSCICYLLHFADVQHPLNTATFPDYSLSLYAAKYWFQHLLRCDGQDALLHLTIRLLEDGSRQYAALNHLHDFQRPFEKPPHWSRSIPSPLFLCYQIGYTEGVRLLLENGADVDAIVGRQGTLFHTAAWEGRAQIVGLLLKRGVNLYPTNTERASPLWIACYRGHTDIVRILLEHGAIASAPDGEVGKALKQASEAGHTEVVRLLLENGAEAKTTKMELGSALYAAVGPVPIHKHRTANEDPTGFIANRIEIIDLLLDKGADINAPGGKYGDLLQAAAAGGMSEIVRVLLNKGLEVGGISGGKYGALQAASKAGHSD
ncbi:hypothetical protein DFH07DRAFT_43908 [Mycena maculata]|uniref:NACHT domain-containing protein n=1 Tax=Mycena maculata TaxID=230809 RepID=A0AAD7IGC2_9AGAR|nr:hypothetical protein DFH07DRAFT_43908 [Mycena maculata]